MPHSLSAIGLQVTISVSFAWLLCSTNRGLCRILTWGHRCLAVPPIRRICEPKCAHARCPVMALPRDP